MMYAQFCRIESAAGGATATPREFIRAAHGFITDTGKARELRDTRHAWLREGLVYLKCARRLYLDVVTGRIGSSNLTAK